MLLRPDRPSKSKVATSSIDTPDDSKDRVVVTTHITSDDYKEAIEDHKLSIQEYRLDFQQFQKEDSRLRLAKGRCLCSWTHTSIAPSLSSITMMPLPKPSQRSSPRWNPVEVLMGGSNRSKKALEISFPIGRAPEEHIQLLRNAAITYVNKKRFVSSCGISLMCSL